MLGNGVSGNIGTLYINNYGVGTQLDFRAQAVIEYYEPHEYDTGPPMSKLIVEASSDWSGIQTITISGVTASPPHPSQTAIFPPITSEDNSQLQSPDQTQTSDSIFTNSLFTLSVGVLFTGVVVVAVLVVLRRHIKTPTCINTTTNSI
ncbi:MAG: hypothetical protein FWD52_03490 [Candidatus Bathyarchaeota archaeon]|nr:hypothetical protein [Candidatus Termiticorpusculum sp.]